MIKKWLALFSVLLSSIPAFSQTGPAGVGTPNTNVFWIKADKGTSSSTNNTPISSWSDQSGNGINVSQSTAVQQPSFATNVMNGFPAIVFDNNATAGQNDYLTAPDNSKLDNTPGYSFFTTTKMNNIGGDARCIVSKRTSIDIDEAFMMFYWEPSYFYLDIDGLGDRQSTSPVTYSTNTPYIMDGIYDGTLPSASRTKIYEGETLRNTYTESSTNVPDKPSPLNIGCTHASNSRPFGGYIAEVIIYTVTVNDAQRIIVNNYLSSKYDIVLSANDKYAGDTPGNGNYDREVSGIGRESSGSNPTFSASISGGITIANTAGLDAGDYILAGHASATNMQITYDVGGMTGINNARWLRIWYLDVTNTATALTNTIEFDMSDGGVGAVPIATAGNYVLLYRAGQTGNWTELTTASSISGDRVIFSGVTLSNDGYYTIGTRNFLVSPLPVELTHFDAIANGDAVDVSWATASEKDHAFFTIEKSRDGISFETLATREGTGTTISTTNYIEKDLNPFDGISYYRLKQNDHNGRYSYSAIVSVDRNQTWDSEVLVFPNPSDENISLIVKGFEKQALELVITDAMGRLCVSYNINVMEAEEMVQLPCRGLLAPGNYVLSISTKDKAYRRKIVVR
jgi:hypothetical protein